jgi:lactate dehydrogenase-like 2-hydroxyacid dehydrogenase
MKVVAYSVNPDEKEFLAKANQKKHDITLIFNSLNLDTAIYANGKQAVIVCAGDDVSARVLEKLASMGVKYISTRSTENDHIDKQAAARYGIKLANVPEHSSVKEMAIQTIKNLDSWEMNKCIGNSCICAQGCRINGIAEKVKDGLG